VALVLVLACVVLAACGGGGATTARAPARTAADPGGRVQPGGPEKSPDWETFHTSAQSTYTGLTAANVGSLRRHEISLPGTVDSSPVLAGGKLIVTTTYGRTLALNADDGHTLWQFTPPGVTSLYGSSQITTATPAVDGSRVFVSAPTGRIYSLRLSDGHATRSWSMTRDPTHEKIASSIQKVPGGILVVTSGYIGDAPPYQGHAVWIDTHTGRIKSVWNSLCANRRGIITPSTCSASDSAIWARAGAVVEPGAHRALVTTGNAPFNGKTNFGDSVIELRLGSHGLSRTQSWTPPDQAELNATDADLGSTTPALLNSRYAIQGGKDGVVRLLGLRPLRPVQSFKGERGGYAFTAPAIGHFSGRSYAFTADQGNTVAYRLAGKKLVVAWSKSTPGTSPILAGGLLYVFDPQGGKLNVYRPQTGSLVTSLPAAGGHWNSPIAYDGRIALPVGDANNHATSGKLELYTP
jgi:outer membrane protein assembly factor BamB